MTLKLSHLKTLCEQATSGPWEKLCMNGDGRHYAVGVSGHSLLGWADRSCCESCYRNFDADAAFVVAINPETAKKLIEIATSAKELLDYLDDEIGMDKPQLTWLRGALRGVE
jgi:hypothetical protein